MRSPSRGAALLLVGASVVVTLIGCAAPTEPVPPGISDAEALELSLSRYAYDLDLVLENYPDVTLPQPLVSTMVSSRAEWSQAQVGCLVGMGIDGVRSTPAGYTVQALNDPETEALARFVCRYQYPLDPRVMGALSAEQAGYAWDYLVHRVVPCMRSIGFEPSPYPDRDDFIAYSARVWGAALWTPYGRFTDKYFGPERTVVDQHCPPLPDDPFAVFNGTLGDRIIGEE